MKKGQSLWNREELILAINLYCKIPFGKIHRNNPEVIKLSKILNRSANAISYKLVNFASLDPSLQRRGIKGAYNTSKLDKEIWNEFYENWDELAFRSEKLRAKYENSTVEKINNIPEEDLPKDGKTREQVIQARVNQSFFRSVVLAAYNYTCCITGISIPELLVAGHIRPWHIDNENRLNPHNGIALNGLHDKAFENGLMTITVNYEIIISPVFKHLVKEEYVQDYFIKFDHKRIILPTKFLPGIEFLKEHNKKLRT